MSNVDFGRIAGRAGSYWKPAPKRTNANDDASFDATAKFETLEDQQDGNSESEGLGSRGNQSFHVKLNRGDFSIKSQFMYGDGQS